MLPSATIHALDPAEPGVHPVVARIRDIILAKAVDGQPTMEDDLAQFTLAEIKTHFPAARRLADRQIVRQLDDDRGFESRPQLLARATGLLLARLPDVAAMHATLRAHGLTNAEIADLWPDLIATTADAFRRARTTPLSREAH